MTEEQRMKLEIGKPRIVPGFVGYFASVYSGEEYLYEACGPDAETALSRARRIVSALQNAPRLAEALRKAIERMEDDAGFGDWPMPDEVQEAREALAACEATKGDDV